MRIRVVIVLLLALCGIFLLPTGPAFAENPAGAKADPASPVPYSPIRLVAPPENTEVIGKKPVVKVDITGSLDGLLVLLDGTDVTQLIKKVDGGFTYTPVANLSGGPHTLKVIAKESAGKEVSREFPFRVKHYTAFDEASSTNQLSIISEIFLGKSGSDGAPPWRKVEGNIRSDNKVKQGGWEFGLDTNVRYLGQSEPPQDPLSRGLDVANWTFTGSYTQDKTKVKASLGDMQVNETPYTVSGLSRKGTVLEAQYDNYEARAFTATSGQVFGVDGGIGTKGTPDERIMGASLGAKFFEKKMEIKGVYVTGGDPSVNAPATTGLSSSTYGTTTTPGSKKGEVFGFLLTSNFFNDKFRTEAEAAFSHYDPDTSDSTNAAHDAAYRLKAEGALGKYTYGASYELIGPNFGTVGNQGAERDKQRFLVTNGYTLGDHAFNLTMFRANDNVRNDDLIPRVIDYNTNFTYGLSAFKNMPISFSYVKDQQRGTGGQSVPRINKDTDTLTGSISYTMNKWSLGYSAAFSYMNDKAPTDNDSQTITHTLSPSYNGETFSASSSLSLNRALTHEPYLWADTYTVGFNMRKDFMNRKLTFDTANTYTRTKASNGSADTRTLNLTGTINYTLKEYLKGGIDPSIALRSSYAKSTDRVNSDNDTEDARFVLVLTLAAPFIF